MTASVAAQQMVIQLQAYLGLSDFSHTSLINYVEPITSTATVAGILPVQIAASTNNVSVALATIFPNCTAPLMFFVLEQTTPTGVALKYGLASGGTRFGLAAGGWAAHRLDGVTALPTIFFDNSTGTAAQILLGVLSN